MKCVICKVGTTAPGKTELVLRAPTTTLIVRDVPADVCDSCGEGYFSEEVSRRVQEMLDEAVASGVEVQIAPWQEQSRGSSKPTAGKRASKSPRLARASKH
jgi:YgiT-type zinc finger domain-containing protein